MKILPPIHTSEETALLIPDYPYGFRLRCQMKVWLEFKKGKGFRFVSMTSNPKRPGTWNKPKASTYSPQAGALYMDENNHVQWSGLHYPDAETARQWLIKYGPGLSAEHNAELQNYIVEKQKWDADYAAGKFKWEIRSKETTL